MTTKNKSALTSLSDTEALLIILYGKSGVGKTLSTVRACPSGAFVGLPGAFRCASYLGWEPKTFHAKGVLETTEFIQQNHGKYPAIIIDDFSLFIVSS